MRIRDIAQRLDLFARSVRQRLKLALSRFSNALKIGAISFHFILQVVPQQLLNQLTLSNNVYAKPTPFVLSAINTIANPCVYTVHFRYR